MVKTRHSRRVLVVLFVTALTCLAAPDAAAQENDSTNSSPRLWVFQAGAGAPHAWNFLSATREFSKGPLRPFATVGYGSFLIGGGIVYYTNPGGTGLALSGAAGVVGFHAAAVFDVRLSEKASIVVGGSYGNYFLQYQGLLPIASFQMRR